MHTQTKYYMQMFNQAEISNQIILLNSFIFIWIMRYLFKWTISYV